MLELSSCVKTHNQFVLANFSKVDDIRNIKLQQWKLLVLTLSSSKKLTFTFFMSCACTCSPLYVPLIIIIIKQHHSAQKSVSYVFSLIRYPCTRTKLALVLKLNYISICRSHDPYLNKDIINFIDVFLYNGSNECNNITMYCSPKMFKSKEQNNVNL